MSKVASKINRKINASKKSKKLQIKVKVKVKAKPKITTKKVSKAKIHKVSKKLQEKELIIIDESQGLIFENDKTLFGFFAQQIKAMEEKYSKHYNIKKDFNQDEVDQLEDWLESTLDDPDEIWIDDESYPDVPMYTLVKTVDNIEIPFNYIAVVYLNAEEKYPSFVFIHFATKDNELAELFRNKEIIYHRKLESIQFAALDGDSLLEGDLLAIGLLESMMKLRSEKDILAEKFQNYAEYRDETINNPDEIWRKVDSEGNTLVTFVSDISENTQADTYYIVITEEDPNSQVHSLLFSFPTNDETLVERYRQGENLEAEEVSTENSH